MPGAEARWQEACRLLARLQAVDAQRLRDPAFSVAKFEEYPNANRYGNVYPYDHALLPGPYLNASLIPPLPDTEDGHGCIMSQAPIPSTFGTFFEHLVTQGTGVLVNLTPLVEHGIPKSDAYWPTSVSQPQLIDDQWKISLLSEQDARDYFDAETTPLAHQVPRLRVRHLQIESLTNEHQHPLVQLHFEGWPDHGALDPQVLIGLVEAIHASLQRSAEPRGPVWAHCSAGLGRSGTLMGAYLVQQQNAAQRASQQALSLAGHVTAHLRNYRAGSIQTPGQLLVLAQAVEQAL